MTRRHATPAEDKRLSFEIVTEAGRIALATAGDTATIPAIERALAASRRLRRLSASTETALRRQLVTARQAERDDAREAEKAERRNDDIRRSRGLPTGSADLTIPRVA